MGKQNKFNCMKTIFGAGHFLLTCSGACQKCSNTKIHHDILFF